MCLHNFVPSQNTPRGVKKLEKTSYARGEVDVDGLTFGREGLGRRNFISRFFSIEIEFFEGYLAGSFGILLMPDR